MSAIHQSIVVQLAGKLGSFLLRLLSWAPTLGLLALLPFTAYYLYCKWSFRTFKKLGISGPEPQLVLGTMGPLMKLGIMEHDMEMRKYGKVVGTYTGTKPLLMIYDTDILKHILVKDFYNFPDRVVPKGTGDGVRKMLHMLKGERWKQVRSVVSPTFSSGKLRKMSAQIRKCSGTLLANLLEGSEKQDYVDVADFCKAFTMDVIASTAFGIEIDSHNNPKNKFVQMGRKAFTASPTSLALIIFFLFPFLLEPLRKLGYTVFPQDVTDFFLDVVNKAVDQRHQEKDNKSVDFLQLLANAEEQSQGAGGSVEGDDELEEIGTKGLHEESLPKLSRSSWMKTDPLTREELLGQGLIFFLAGFETTANTLSLFAYILATHQDIQSRLIEEIDSVIKEDDEPDYDNVKKLPFMEMCIRETLRLYPAGIRTDRVAEEDININGLFIPKGMNIGIPIYAIHHDPELWPNPEEFDPERFSPEAIKTRDPYSYLPFGLGPRGCAGLRLALTELKIAIVTLMRNMTFQTCPQTQIPLKLDKLTMKGTEGIKLKIVKRSKGKAASV